MGVAHLRHCEFFLNRKKIWVFVFCCFLFVCLFVLSLSNLTWNRFFIQTRHFLTPLTFPVSKQEIESLMNFYWKIWAKTSVNFTVVDSTQERVITFTAGVSACSKFTCSNTRARCEICSKLTIKASERNHWRRSSVFTVNFDYISHLLLTLNR